MQVSNLVLVCGLAGGDYQMNIWWVNPVTAFEKVRIVYNTTAVPTAIDDGSFHEITDGSNSWLHTGLTLGETNYYSVYVYDGTSWGTPVSTAYGTENSWGTSGTAFLMHVLNDVGTGVDSHTVTWTRTRGSQVLFTGTTSATGDATATLGAAGETSDTVLWIGDEVTVLVESTPGTTLYETTFDMDGSMFGTLYGALIELTVEPASVAAQYPATPTIPAGINLSSTAMSHPYFIWDHTPDPDNLPSGGKVHYAIELDTDIGFASADYRLYKSVTDATGFEYSLEASSYETWMPFPSEGLVETGNARIRYTVPAGEAALSETTWHWRVYSTDLTPAV